MQWYVQNCLKFYRTSYTESYLQVCSRSYRTSYTDSDVQVCFHPDGRIIATGSQSGNVNLFLSDILHADEIPSKIFSDVLHADKIACKILSDILYGFFWYAQVCFHPDGRIIATGSQSGNVNLFAVAATGDKPEAVPKVNSPIKSVIFLRKWPICGTDNRRTHRAEFLLALPRS